MGKRSDINRANGTCVFIVRRRRSVIEEYIRRILGSAEARSPMKTSLTDV